MLRKTVLNGLYYSKLDELLSPVTQGIGSVWMLHRVNNAMHGPFSPNSHLAISPEFLDMAILQYKSKGYQFASMDEMADHLSSNDIDRAGRKLISITLDDAYQDNYKQAFPVFHRHDVPYTIFVAPGLVDGTHTLWWEDLEKAVAGNRKITFKVGGKIKTLETANSRDKLYAYCKLLRCLSNDVSEDEQREIVAKLSLDTGHDATAYVKSEIMDWDLLKEISANPLCTLGAHTMGHYALARLETERARSEMLESKAHLEKLIGKPVGHFAYPYGYASAVGEREFGLAKELGFKTAVTTKHGIVYAADSERMHNIPRISINGNFQSLHYLRPLISGLTTKFGRFSELMKVA